MKVEYVAQPRTRFVEFFGKSSDKKQRPRALLRGGAIVADIGFGNNLYFRAVLQFGNHHRLRRRRTAQVQCAVARLADHYRLITCKLLHRFFLQRLLLGFFRFLFGLFFLRLLLLFRLKCLPQFHVRLRLAVDFIFPLLLSDFLFFQLRFFGAFGFLFLLLRQLLFQCGQLFFRFVVALLQRAARQQEHSGSKGDQFFVCHG
ncbi:hypothetical protein CGZ77_01075 [Neisseria sp. KEM232]|nr:hypothetical protein CGZ77_01075 [Neisseria sp. KEM232]